MKKNLFSLLVLISMLLAMVSSAAASPLTVPTASQPTGQQAPHQFVVRVYYSSHDELNHLASRYDVIEVDQSARIAYLLVSDAELASLQQSGYRIEVDEAKTKLINQPHLLLPGQGPDSIPGYPCYRTVEETFASLQDIVTAHPDMAELYDIGDSWDKTMPGGNAGYDINALRLTNENFGVIDDKPTFFLMAEIHAREYATAELAMRYAEYLINNYNIDPDITWLLNYFRVFVVTMTNPDGRKHAENGEMWRKNVDNDDGCNDQYSWGTDLNRNYSYKWAYDNNGSDPYACGETYRGPSASSEPETQTIQNFVRSIFADQRGPGDIDPAPLDANGMFLTLHSAAALVLWPWGYEGTDAPNGEELQTLGRHMAFFNGYYPEQSNDLYATNGTTDDWSYGELGIASFTFEMAGSFFQDCYSFENTDVPDNINALLYAFKSARRPYMNPAGPDSLDLIVTPDLVPAGVPVQLTATANDGRYGGGEQYQDIAAGRYSIDNPSWITGTVTYPMEASDGNFDNYIEGIQATVDTGGLLEGRHTIFVESQDADGNWGVTSSVFIDTITPDYGVLLSPASATVHGDPGDTLTYQLQALNYGLNGDSYDISVASNWEYSAPGSTGYLAPGEKLSLDVQVTIPVTATHGESDSAVVMISSQTNPGVDDVSTLSSIANFFDVGIAPASSKGSADPGKQVNYTLQVTNHGNVTDSFDLTSSSQWTVTLPSESVGPLAPGETIDIAVSVDVPLDGVPGDSDTATIAATSQGNGSKTGSATLVTSVKTFYSFLAKAPENHLTAYGKGISVDYTVMITNTGNITDSYEVLVSFSNWPVDVPASVGPVGSGKSTIATITVHVPLDIDIGDTNIARLQFVSVGGSSSRPVLLYTNTTWFRVFIPISRK